MITDAKVVRSDRGRRWFYRCRCGRRCNKGPMVLHLTGSRHGLSLSDAYNAIEEAQARALTASEERYPCARCGKLRTKAEGGTTFTVCDKCWDETMGSATTEFDIETGYWGKWQKAEAERDRLQRENEALREFVREVAMEAYTDSDLASLLRTLQERARDILARIRAEAPKENSDES